MLPPFHPAEFVWFIWVITKVFVNDECGCFPAKKTLSDSRYLPSTYPHKLLSLYLAWHVFYNNWKFLQLNRFEVS